jgi:hypothetical protein
MSVSLGFAERCNEKELGDSVMKLKYIVVFTIIMILLSSFIAYLPVENTSVPAEQLPTSVDTLDPAGSPSPTHQANVANKTKNNVITNFGNAIRSFGTSITEFFDGEKPVGPVTAAQTMNNTVWKEIAQNAWQYFQVNRNVDSGTGLHGAGEDYPWFTDWDLGVYIQAVIDAQKIGLITKNGTWGSDDRLEKIVRFLENRPLTNEKLPFWWYQASDGQPWTEGQWYGISSINVADSGRLLVALNNLKTYNNNYSSRIDYVVYSKTNYTSMLPEIKWLASSNNIYDYYVTSGFASFSNATIWKEISNVPQSILNNILSGTLVPMGGGVQLPASKISCDPLLLSLFELKPNSALTELARKVYLAHEARYNATLNYVAFSEGTTPPYYNFVYEWVILPDRRTWIIQDPDGYDVGISPVAYARIAFGFLGLYNSTYARDMVIYLEDKLPSPAGGYVEGVAENGELASGLSDKTNGLIIGAARYAMMA